MAFDKVETPFVEAFGVETAGSGALIRDLVVSQGEPVRVGGFLTLEVAAEAGDDIGEFEGADGAAGDRVVGRGEDAVDNLVFGAVEGVRGEGRGRGLDFIEVEGKVARDGTVQPGLQEGGPLVLKFV